MALYQVTLKSKSPYSQGRHYDKETVEPLDKEGNHAYEKRTWRHRIHADERGEVYIPPMALKNCLAEAAQYLGIQIPGKGKQNYTKHFVAGIMVLDPIMLGIQRDDVASEQLFVPADGKRGGGKRVTKIFPFVPSWSGTTTITVLDATITGDVLEKHLREAGNLIGIGRFRPRNNGYYGRFSLVSIEEVK